MSDEQKDAIEALERRVATLENLIRRLSFAADSKVQLKASRAPQPPPPVRASLPTLTPAVRQPTDLEQWFGQRALLAVGVLALLTAAALFLKYAFDRGWIAPWARALGAVVAGLAVAAWGHERIGKGMRRYGAALIGAGGGLVYLGLWAAAGPYALMERRLGILLLAATTVGVTMLALHHEVEGLAIWALGGAYLAPVVLATSPNARAFLAYIEVIGLGTAVLAYTMKWRLTFSLALFGYLLLAMGGAGDAIATASGFWLIAASGVLALHVTAQRPWSEARVGLLLLMWAALGAGTGNFIGLPSARWVALAAVVFVFGLLWWQQLGRDPFTMPATTGDAVSERFLFVTSPMALLMIAVALRIPGLIEVQEVVPATLALLYLGAAWQRRSAALLIMGFALAATAAVVAWDGVPVAIAWTLLAVLALAAERQGGRAGGQYAAVGLATLAFFCLFTSALIERPLAAPAFTDRWALALYLFLAGTAIAARAWGADSARPLWKRGGAEWMWILCGAAAFVGGSIEFKRHFSTMTLLAGDLALSVWWLLYAAALVFLGFRLDRKPVRSVGLIVAGFTGLKIVFYDLSNLSALYRVGSFFALAIIALAVAYAYNQKARASAA